MSPAFISSAGIKSMPGNLYLFIFSITIYTSKELGSGIQVLKAQLYVFLPNTINAMYIPTADRSNSSLHSKYCRNLQADHNSHLLLCQL
jgi:hypothetical protein